MAEILSGVEPRASIAKTSHISTGTDNRTLPKAANATLRLQNPRDSVHLALLHGVAHGTLNRFLQVPNTLLGCGIEPLEIPRREIFKRILFAMLADGFRGQQNCDNANRKGKAEFALELHKQVQDTGLGARLVSWQAEASTGFQTCPCAGQ